MSKNSKDGLFTRIVEEDNFYKAYRTCLKGKSKYKPEAMRFALDEVYNLQQLRQSLIDETYEFDGYISFTVFEPKERMVDAPHFKDKIVQLAINNVLKEVFVPCFIHDSYACMDGRGTHKCADRISHFLRKTKWDYGDKAYIIKGDVSKFFYTIDREVLKKLLARKIKCTKTIRLLFKIIDSADVLDLRGLPLGNTISQVSANIYLNELDQFCKRKLGLKYYIRYMDDFIVITKTKDEANRILKLINEFIEAKLHLKLNQDKTKIFPIDQGVNSIGYKIHATHRLLRNSSKKKIKRKVRAMPRLIREGRLTVRKAEQMLNSWKGHADYANNYNFIQSLIKKYDFIYTGKKEKLRIDIKRLEATEE